MHGATLRFILAPDIYGSSVHKFLSLTARSKKKQSCTALEIRKGYLKIP